MSCTRQVTESGGFITAKQAAAIRRIKRASGRSSEISTAGAARTLVYGFPLLTGFLGSRLGNALANARGDKKHRRSYREIGGILGGLAALPTVATKSVLMQAQDPFTASVFAPYFFVGNHQTMAPAILGGTAGMTVGHLGGKGVARMMGWKDPETAKSIGRLLGLTTGIIGSASVPDSFFSPNRQSELTGHKS